MSSSGSPFAGGRQEPPEPPSPRGSDTAWHPAREWLEQAEEEGEEEDEDDLDYEPWSDEEEHADMHDTWEDDYAEDQYGRMTTLYIC